MDIEKLKDLCRRYIEAKRKEDEAATERKNIGSDIAMIMEPELKAKGKAVGSVTQKLADLGVKIGCDFGINRTVSSGIVDDFDKLPDAVKSSIRWKPEVIEAKYKELSDADRFAASPYVTTKPASPSIKIEVI